MKKQNILFNLNNNYILYIFISIISIILGYLSLGKNINIDIYHPFVDDYNLLYAIVKSIQENGLMGLFFNNRIGAPETSALIDYPCCDLLMGIIVWLISLFTSSVSKIIYLFLIITFVLDSVSMAWFLRKLKINIECTFTISLLFSFSYFHFFRYIIHIPLSNYMSFAITMYLVCCILDILENENKYTIFVCSIILGIGYPYYWFMGLILIVIAYIIQIIRKQKISNKLYIFFTIIVFIIISLFPKIYYSLNKGINNEILNRQVLEQETFGLKIVQLFIPNQNSKISIFRDISLTYNNCSNTVNENVSSYLGIVSIIGFVALFSFFIYSFFKNNKKEIKTWLLIDFLSFSTVFFMLFGSIGGFGCLFNIFINPIFRSQNRFSIFIMGFSLIAISLIINKIAEYKRLYSYFICFIILMIGMFEQYEIKNVDYKILEESQKKYESFFYNVEKKLSKNSMIYQLPYIDFPESGTKNKMPYYRHFIGYIFSKHLRWSYGGIKGRNLIAENLNIDDGMSYSFLENIKRTGFNAVYIDIDGYKDKGKEILNFYNALNIESIISDDKKFYVYDISNISFDDIRKKIEVYEKGRDIYYFVNKITDKYILYLFNMHNIDIASDSSFKDMFSDLLLRGLIFRDKKVYKQIVKLESKIIFNLSDSNYIDYVYNSLLKRSESEKELKYWLREIDKGITREEIYYRFLDSQEFRNLYKLDNIEI